MSKKSLHFIINPISGTGKQNGIKEKIKKEINPELFNVQLHYTREANQATKIAADLVGQKADYIVAVGGDGTVNEIAQALVNSQSTLAIIPAGSGNGLSRHLAIPQNINKALRLINSQNCKQIDSCTANGKFFINVSGLGYDGHIAHVFSKARKRGMKTYVKLILSEWWKYKLKHYKITVAGETVYNDKAVLVSFANATQYGNNVVISPKSEDDDGLLDLCILKSFNIYEIPYLLLALASKRLHKHRRIKIISCSEAQITTENAKLHLDGEPTDLKNCIELKVLPKSINIISNKLV